jgi:hypothetical protein
MTETSSQLLANLLIRAGNHTDTENDEIHFIASLGAEIKVLWDVPGIDF